MIRLLAALAVLATCAAPGLALADPTGPTLSVFGRGAASAAPDRATVRASIRTNEPSAAAALGEADAARARVGRALRAAGLPLAAVRDGDLGLGVVEDGDPSVRLHRRRYAASRSLSVEVGSIDRVGPTIDALVLAGGDALALEGVTFASSQATTLRLTAQAAAVADAERQARGLAAAAHERIARVRSLAADDAGPEPPPIRPFAMARMSAAAAPATTLAPGEVSVRAGVGIVYDLAPAP